MANAGEVGSVGDTSGGFRIAGDPTVFAPAGVGNDFHGVDAGIHVGVHRSSPSIFVQHGSGAGSAGDTASAGAGDNGAGEGSRPKRGRSAGESSHSPPRGPERAAPTEDRPSNFRSNSRGPTGNERGPFPRAGAGANNIPVGVDPNIWLNFLEFQKFMGGNMSRQETKRVVLDEKYFRRIKQFEGDSKLPLRTWLFDFLVAIGQLDDNLSAEFKKSVSERGVPR